MQTTQEKLLDLTPREREIRSWYDIGFSQRALIRSAERLSKSAQLELAKRLSRFGIVVPENIAPERKLRLVYECISSMCTYDHAESDIRYTYVSVLLRNTAVCQGFAEFMTGMLSAMGVHVITIVGGIKGCTDTGHSWNMVELNGNYYHFDVTWDLQKSAWSFEHYLKSDAEMVARKHFWDPALYPRAACNYKSRDLDQNEREVLKELCRVLRQERILALLTAKAS